MSASKIIRDVNRMMDNHDFVAARQCIEDNQDMFAEHKHRLQRNVRELLDVITSMQDSDVRPLNRQELHKIHHINKYASQFDVRGLQLAVQENADLLLREEVQSYLSADAKALLEGMTNVH